MCRENHKDYFLGAKYQVGYREASHKPLKLYSIAMLEKRLLNLRSNVAAKDNSLCIANRTISKHLATVVC